jgi:phage shock protein PspC (stress-responsive transcriptional regulator)
LWPGARRATIEDVNDSTASPHGTTGGEAGPRRLVRTADGKLGGVAAGIGHYLGVDPTLVRLAFVALVFAGGLGVLLYGIGWLVIPKGEVDEHVSPPQVDGWLVVGVLALVAGVGLLFGWHGVGDAGRVVLALALVVGGVLLLTRTRRDDDTGGRAVPPPPQPPPTTPAPATALADEPGRPAAEAASAPVTAGPEPDAPGRRVPLTAGVLSVLAIGGAALLAGVLSDELDVTVSIALAGALVVVAAGLIVAAAVGSAPWLFVVASLLTSALLVAATVEPYVDDGLGTRTYAPATASELRPTYRLGAGRLTVDLTGLAPVGTRRLSVRVGAGDATIRVPGDVDLVLRSHVGAGRLEAAGRAADGVNERLDLVENAVGARGRVVVDLRIGIGKGRVERG